MTKVHVLFRKEEMDEQKISDKTVVVLDVLLATSTITSLLQFGAKEVIPLAYEEAIAMRNHCQQDEDYIFVGEYRGEKMQRFLLPSPLLLKDEVTHRSVVLSTTNGTVAIRQAKGAKHVFIASLLNGEAVAREVAAIGEEQTIVIVCSGSSGEFCIEDFYGAGYLINCLIKYEQSKWNLSDAAYCAWQFYLGRREDGFELLLESRVGKMLQTLGYEEDIRFISKQNTFSITPYVSGDRIIVK